MDRAGHAGRGREDSVIPGGQAGKAVHHQRDGITGTCYATPKSDDVGFGYVEWALPVVYAIDLPHDIQIPDQPCCEPS